MGKKKKKKDKMPKLKDGKEESPSLQVVLGLLHEQVLLNKALIPRFTRLREIFSSHLEDYKRSGIREVVAKAEATADQLIKLAHKMEKNTEAMGKLNDKLEEVSKELKTHVEGYHSFGMEKIASRTVEMQKEIALLRKEVSDLHKRTMKNLRQKEKLKKTRSFWNRLMFWK